tara:strand:+ start:695 stop:805 length:111 start_codon:yes stop_codon:yes gene_type:complete
MVVQSVEGGRFWRDSMIFSAKIQILPKNGIQQKMEI